MDVIERDGLRFKVELRPDENWPPWKEFDGHGIVSDWKRELTPYGYPKKRPGERILHQDGRSFMTYDWQATMKKARKEWGFKNGMNAVKAVQADFDRLKAWCEGSWCYCVVYVTLVDTDGSPTDRSECVGGVESDCWEETAQELAAQISAEVGSSNVVQSTRVWEIR